MEDLPLPIDAKLHSLSTNKRRGRPDLFVIQSIATTILLHGLGSGGEKFWVEFLESGISSAGIAMVNQWFNLASLENPVECTDLQIDGLGESARHVRSILSQEMEVVPPQNIILGGLSQGCAMAVFILLSLEFPIGGFVGMSGWLPFEKDLGEIVRLGGAKDGETETGHAVGLARDVLSIEENNVTSLTHDHTCLETPTFLGHGEKDEKIKCKFREGAAKTLASLGLDVVWKSYAELGHWYGIPDEIDDILGFLRDTLTLGKINN
ncbi:Alpha/Beta hydrolase protein [Lineolata rhizophorae]|uniref:Alpha/Beta hydrolase protein n=1 Tax=Lineolata rhizophorae TaxID=578093 RepID=A0A6A6NRB0_9PEZI|nr:Alpha/Beta hydrolase protein [Lineolata rhizophorae]